ncbi:hypothetical protein [Kitasatospora sp. McL0602]
MVEGILAVLIPVGLLALAGVGYWFWAEHGTEEPIEHHSSMPHEHKWPEG